MAGNNNSNPRQYVQWKVLSICPNQGLSKDLGALIAENLPFAPCTEIKEYPARVDLAEMVPAQNPNIAFVDVSTNEEWAASIISDLTAIDPKLVVVAVHSANNPDFILRCMRMGSTEFLLQPITPEQLSDVLDRVAVTLRNGRGSASIAKVVCVVPAKGACGASTIACGLAYQWKRLGAQRILLADLDPLTGTQSFMLKLRQTYSFMDALSRQGTLDTDVWKGLVFNAGGVDVMLAPEKPVHGIDENYDPSGIIEFARTSYEMVALDTAGAYGNWALTLVRLSDEVLLVTTNELPALQATQRALAYFDRNRIERAKIKIVVNRYSKNMGLNQDVIEAALHTDIFQTLPSDYEVVQHALVEGKPIASATSVGKGLAAMAETTFGKGPRKEPKSSGGGLGSLFSALLRR